MSADNWEFCPRCLQQRKERLAEREAEVVAMYGVVPPDEFDAARAALEDARLVGTREEDATFREDYEFSGARDGEVTAYYKGVCQTCGLECRFTYSKRFYDVEPSDA